MNKADNRRLKLDKGIPNDKEMYNLNVLFNIKNTGNEPNNGILHKKTKYEECDFINNQTDISMEMKNLFKQKCICPMETEKPIVCYNHPGNSTEDRSRRGGEKIFKGENPVLAEKRSHVSSPSKKSKLSPQLIDLDYRQQCCWKRRKKNNSRLGSGTSQLITMETLARANHSKEVVKNSNAKRQANLKDYCKIMNRNYYVNHLPTIYEGQELSSLLLLEKENKIINKILCKKCINKGSLLNGGIINGRSTDDITHDTVSNYGACRMTNKKGGQEMTREMGPFSSLNNNKHAYNTNTVKVGQCFHEPGGGKRPSRLLEVNNNIEKNNIKQMISRYHNPPDSSRHEDNLTNKYGTLMKPSNQYSVWEQNIIFREDIISDLLQETQGTRESDPGTHPFVQNTCLRNNEGRAYSADLYHFLFSRRQSFGENYARDREIYESVL